MIIAGIVQRHALLTVPMPPAVSFRAGTFYDFSIICENAFVFTDSVFGAFKDTPSAFVA
jgi:hypothetical protein